MQKEKKKVEEFHDYGVEEYIPQEARHYRSIDMFFTWLGANCQPNTWYLGGCLAASGFMMACGVTLVANPFIYLAVALIGLMGYKVSTTSMGLARVSFGINGSKLVSLFNTISLVGWVSVTNFIGAISMSYMLNHLFGMPAYGMEGSTVTMIIGTMINAILSVVLVSLGGSKSVKIAENVTVVLMTVLSIWITVAVLRQFPLGDIVNWKAPAETYKPLGYGIDLIIAFSLSWAPCVADYTRYTKSAKSSTVAPVLGAMAGIFWFTLVGTIATIAAALLTGKFDIYANDPSSVAASLGLGVPALIVIVLSTITTNMVSIFSGSCSVMNMIKKPIPLKKMSIIVGAITILMSFVPIMFGTFLDFFYVFMDVVALMFPPLVGIMIVDYFILRKGNYVQKELVNEKGPYWYKKGLNWCAFVTVAIGIVCFLVFKRVPFVVNAVGAALPTLVLCGLSYYICAKISIAKGQYKDLVR